MKPKKPFNSVSHTCAVTQDTHSVTLDRFRKLSDAWWGTNRPRLAEYQDTVSCESRSEAGICSWIKWCLYHKDVKQLIALIVSLKQDIQYQLNEYYHNNKYMYSVKNMRHKATCDHPCVRVCYVIMLCVDDVSLINTFTFHAIFYLSHSPSSSHHIS